MAKRKLSDEPDISFVHEAPCSEETKTISVKIKDFTKKIDDLDNKKKPIGSPSFTVAGKKLHICVFPEYENCGEFIAVLLGNLSKEKIIVTAKFKSSCGMKPTTIMKNKDIPDGQMIGYPQFLSHDAFRKWAEENEDIFCLDVTVTLHIKGAGNWTTKRTKPQLKFDPIQEASVVWGNNNNQEEDFSDFTIFSQEGTKFPCHRLILGSQSPPFRSMMTLDTKEKKEGQVKLQFKEEVVKGFVGFFYSRKIPQEILEGNLESFLDLAESYDLAPLKLQVEEAAISLLTTENMVDMFHLGDFYRANQLKEASEFLISRNKEILKGLDLSRFPATTINGVLRLLC